MVVVVVIGVLAMLAAPNLGPLISKNNLSSQANAFLADLNFARSEAIKRAANVVMCKSTNPNASTPTCDSTAANPWSSGWLIFVDQNSNNNYLAADDVLIKVRGALEAGLQLSAAASAGTPNPQNQLEFRRTGGSAEAAVFTLCDPTAGLERRLITINSVGRATLSKGTKGCT